jgi:adenylate kinase
VIIFTGVAGSGKSVQGRMLADRLGLPWLSTGEFLRMLVSGERRKEMVAGKLLNDKEIIKLVQKIFALIDTHQEFVLDGFPRTHAQADWLLAQVKHGQLDITAVIHLKAEKQTVRERLMSRGRQDDNDKAIEGRFTEYEESIIPILDEFKSNGVNVIEIDGSKPVDDVHKAIISQIPPQ